MPAYDALHPYKTMLKLKGTPSEIKEQLSSIIIETEYLHAGLIEEMTLIDWEAMEKELNQTNEPRNN